MKGLEALDKVARYCSDMRTMGKAREELKGELDVILKDLERLEEFEKVLNGHCSKCVNRENNICVGMDAPIHIDTLINCIEMLSTELQMENQELKDENQILKKALDKACEMLEWDCPVELDLIDDLDCENCNGTYKECWKKYCLKEVIENDR